MADEKPREHWRVIATGEDLHECGEIDSLASAAHVARMHARSAASGGFVVWRCVPVAMYRPREPERIDLTEAPAPSEDRPWYPDEGPWEELTPEVRKRLRTTDSDAQFEFLLGGERSDRKYRRGCHRGKFLADVCAVVAVKRVQP